MSFTTPVDFLELQTRVREILEDTGANKQWSDTIVQRYINDAAQDFAIRTKCTRKYSTPLAANSSFETLGTGVLSPGSPTITSVTNIGSWRVGAYLYSTIPNQVAPSATILSVNTTLNTVTMSANSLWPTPVSATFTDKAYAFYTMPSDLHELESVWVNGYHVPQSRTDRLPYQWDIETCSSTAEPTCYIYGDYGLSVLRFWPFPTDAAYPTARVYYTALPAVMTNNTDKPTGIPDRYAVALVYYTVAMCYRRNFEDNDRRKSEEFMGLYLDQVRDCQGRIERLMNAEGMGVPYRHL